MESTTSLNTLICLVPVSGIVTPSQRVFGGVDDASSYLSYEWHNGSYIFGLFQRRHPELARLSSHLEGFTPELLLQESLVFFGELHDYNTVRHQEANELPIVNVAEATHHLSGSYSIPI